MPFISSSYDGSSRRSSGSSDFSGLRGLDRFSSSRKSSVYERPSTYTSSSSTSATAPSTTVSSPVPNYRSLERIKNGTSGSNSSTSGGVGNYDNGSNSTSGKSSTSSYLSSTTPSRFSRNSDSTSGYSSSRHDSTSSPFGLPRRDSSTSSYLRSESNNGNDYPTSTTSYGGGNSNNSTLERSSYTKPASRSNSSNLFNLESNNNDNNNLNEPTPTTTSSRFSSSYSESGTTTPAATTTATGFSRKNSMVDLNGIADMTKRINETLARHGLDEKKTYPSYEAPTPKQPSYNGRLSDNRYHHSTRESRDREIVGTTATPTGSWRRRHDSNNTNNAPVLSSTPSSPPAMIKAVEPPKWDISDSTTVTAMKTVISRCTSPASKNSDQRTRIARTTDPIVVEHRRSRKPRVVDNYCQTDVTPEYGTLADHLKPPPPPPEPVVLKDKSPEVTRVASFDYFARMQSMMDSNNGTKFAPKEPESEEEEEDYYKVKRAPMMMLLPGTRNSQVESPAPISPNKKLSDALSTNSNNIETEEESEYTYETEEEEEEEDGVQENGILPPDDLESYEIKAERVLEEQRERVSIAPELDYIDEEDEDVQPQVTSPKRKKKGPFISGTIDIDDLLAKEQTPTNFALDDNSITSPAPPCTQEPKKHVEFSETVSSKEVPQDDSWWPETNGHDIGSQLVTQLESVEDTVKSRLYGTQDDEQKDIEVGVEENGVEEWEEEEEEEEEEEAEGAGEEEGDWEWEYYSNEEGTETEDEPKVAEATHEESPSKMINQLCAQSAWIVKGLKQMVPRIPNKRDTAKLQKDIPDSEEEDQEEEAPVVPAMTSAISTSDLCQEMGYKEWLEESEQLHEGAHLHLQAEIEAEDILLRSQSSGKDSDKSKEGSPRPMGSKLSKASRLVDKIKNSENMDQKRVLFSLKTFFQSDKDLVYEFVKEGGLSLLIELGEDDEAQLQNLILRALGQIMLYVDGMNGVMENTKAIQFLYKLVLASNPLVCKTAIKLLLVFVEYTENNCLLMIKAINAVDKDLGVIPWSNVIITVQNANKDSAKRSAMDVELAMYGLTLINKCLYGIPDQDTFYDQTDYMEELNMSSIIDSLTNLDAAEGVDGGLMQQVQLYNVAMKQEDGEPVTEDEISYLDEDATETGLRTTLRAKADKGKRNKQFQERKSLRYKTKMLANDDVDSQGDMAGISIRDIEIILAKNGLPTSRSGTALNALTLNGFLDKARGVFNAKISKGEDEEEEEEEGDDDLICTNFEREGQAKWDEIVNSIERPFVICDLDFTDLTDDSDSESGKVTVNRKVDSNGIPLPPPAPPAPPPAPPAPPAPPPPGSNIPLPPAAPSMMNGTTSNEQKWSLISRKTRKTAKLFWKEIRQSQAYNKTTEDTIWDNMEPAGVDTAMIEYLFENRAKEVTQSKDKNQVQMSSAREIIVLDHKRSNAINIGMTKLPPPRIIKSAVMKMDSTIMTREGVEKLLTMLPTDEESTRIQEAQEAQSDIPLGTAEQFLQTLSTISCLEARLRLWSFKMEFEVIEKEVCDPMMDLKTGIVTLRNNSTFKTILNVLLTFGNFLNGSSCRGFQLDYLEKVPEVKDTVHKHSLLYHMTYWVLETYPGSSDLYSEIGPLTRTSRTDFQELQKTLKRMEAECKNAWDYLKIITRHDEKHMKLLKQQQEEEHLLDRKPIDDPNEPTRRRLQEFLTDAAERIYIMMKVHKRVTKRYYEFLSWMGIPIHFHGDYPVHKTCKILSEFALEYRTTRERVIQTIEKKKALRERKKKEKKSAQMAALLAEAAKLQSPTLEEDKSVTQRVSREEVDDSQLKLLLGQDIDVTENGTLRRKKKHHHHRHHSRHHKSSAQPMLSENGLEETSDELMKAMGALSDRGLVDRDPKKYEEKELRREKKTRRHRSSMMDGTLPLTEDNYKEFTTNEMERGLLETLMATSDSSTLKRNKDRRKSVKERRSGSGTHDLKRSRTRENNVLDDLENAAEALANL